MKVFLLKLDDRRHTFYSEGPAEVADESGLKGWLKKRVEHWQGRLDRSDGWLARTARRVRKALERFVGRDEPLLRGLRKTDSVMIHHPRAWTRDQAAEAWSAFIRQRKRHHAIWLVANALMGAPSVVLAVLPGPNFVGYWFAYRVACHGLALLGIRRALGGRVSVEFWAEEGLDKPLDQVGPDQIGRLAEDCGLRGLDVFLMDGEAGQTVEPPAEFSDDPVRTLREREDEGPDRPGPYLSSTVPEGSPGAGREVGQCGS